MQKNKCHEVKFSVRYAEKFRKKINSFRLMGKNADVCPCFIVQSTMYTQNFSDIFVCYRSKLALAHVLSLERRVLLTFF